jgi:hypothetical protein
MLDYLLWLLAVPACFILYFIYHFFIRIYLVAARFKKIDPSLKLLTNPIFGLLGVQQ